jgi:hypothetical protein
MNAVTVTLFDADEVRLTGLLVTRLTPAQHARVKAAADARGWYVAEYLRRRIVPHMRARGTR